MTAEALKSRSRADLAGLARRRGIARWHDLSKDELVRALVRVARSSEAARGRVRARPPSRKRKGAGASGASAARSARRTPRVNGHADPLRDRDLCTTAVADRNPRGRTNFLDIAECGPHWLRAVWDLTRDSIRRAQTRLAADWHRAVPVLRLFEVRTDDVGGVSDRFVRDVVIEAGLNTWYVHAPQGGRTYRLHIGYRTAGGRFFAVAKSNLCTMPSPNVNLAASKNDKPARPARGQAANGAAPAGRAYQELPEHRLGRPLGFSSLSHFGPAATVERETGEFVFQLDTELIIHGATRPGSSLQVQGDPVELRDDGSFTIRVNQPEGRQVLAFTALSPTGSERRMVVIGVERNTRELERQYFDGGHPEGFLE